MKQGILWWLGTRLSHRSDRTSLIPPCCKTWCLRVSMYSVFLLTWLSLIPSTISTTFALDAMEMCDIHARNSSSLREGSRLCCRQDCERMDLVWSVKSLARKNKVGLPAFNRESAYFAKLYVLPVPHFPTIRISPRSLAFVTTRWSLSCRHRREYVA